MRVTDWDFQNIEGPISLYIVSLFPRIQVLAIPAI